MQPTGSSSVSVFVPRESPCRKRVCRDTPPEALDPTLIAELSDCRIHQMTRPELMRVIRAASPPFVKEKCRRRLVNFDRAMLERLVFLTRYCCRNRIARSTKKSGKDGHARFNTKEK